MADKIKALFIYEILGKPPEHIRITLEQLIDRIGENRGIKVISRKVHEPHPLDEEKKKNIKIEQEIYSTFAEVELAIDNLSLLFAVVLNTLPSNIEILEPNELKLKNFDLSSVLSELTIKLHKYDEIAKALILEKNHLIKKLNELEKNSPNIKIKNIGVEKDFDKKNKTEEKV